MGTPEFLLSVDINSWFDIREPSHIIAFKYLQDHGKWPEGFIPDGIAFEPNWYQSLVEKLASRYVQLFLVGLDG